MSGDKRAYVVAHIQIDDRDRYAQYEAGFAPILIRYQGQIVALSEAPESLEGNPLASRVIVARFPSRQHAVDWFNDPEYQAIAEHRRAASHADFVSIVDEFVMPADPAAAR